MYLLSAHPASKMAASAIRKLARSQNTAILSKILATRSIIGAAIRPLNLTEQADFLLRRSGAGQASRLILACMCELRRPRRNLYWVGAKSADRDLPMPRLQQSCWAWSLTGTPS